MAKHWDLNGSINNSLRETVKASTPGEQSWKIPQGRICLNQKWKQSPLLDCLKKNHCQFIFSEDSANVVDFYPSEGVAVVYLSEADVVLNSTYDYRRKLARLRNTRGLRGMVFFELSEITKQYLRAVQEFTVLDLGLVLLTVANQSEAAQLLLQISTVESNERSNAFRIKKSMPSHDDAALQTVLQIPGIGETKAKQLLSNFRSVSNIGGATEQDLATVVGKGAAEKVWNFFR